MVFFFVGNKEKKQCCLTWRFLISNLFLLQRWMVCWFILMIKFGFWLSLDSHDEHRDFERSSNQTHSLEWNHHWINNWQRSKWFGFQGSVVEERQTVSGISTWLIIISLTEHEIMINFSGKAQDIALKEMICGLEEFSPEVLDEFLKEIKLMRFSFSFPIFKPTPHQN